MTEASPESLRAQVARIRRIVRDLTDQRARQALLALAEEYEARATEEDLHSGPAMQKRQQ